MVGAVAGGDGSLINNHNQAQAGVVPGHQAGVVPGHQAGIASGHQEGIVPGHQSGIVPGHQTQAPYAGEGLASGPTGAMRRQSVVDSSHPVSGEQRL
jgi:hypothetical protein